MSRYRRDSPREVYEAGMIYTEWDLHVLVDSCRESAKSSRIAAFWLAYVPGLIIAYAWAEAANAGATGWAPFFGIFIAPVPSIVWAQRQESRADDLELYHHLALERRRKQQK
jgi:hypothetical protein